jgi:hypothetical protein
MLSFPLALDSLTTTQSLSGDVSVEYTLHGYLLDHPVQIKVPPILISKLDELLARHAAESSQPEEKPQSYEDSPDYQLGSLEYGSGGFSDD